MPILLEEELNAKLPKMHHVKQKFKKESLENIEEKIKEELHKPGIRKLIKKGQRIAVAVGSRGIDRIDLVVKTTVDLLIEFGAAPFIISAMGSHGGGTEYGQREILASYHITEKTMGVPVITSQDTVKIGETKDHYEIFTDQAAYEADMTILINRIKPHTDFTGPIESGLCKMSVIGLGNHKGCAAIHKAGFDHFKDIIREAAGILFDSGNIGFGIGIVENSIEKILEIEAIRTEDIPAREPVLLKKAKSVMPRLYFPEIDILLVDEIGKNISGNGIDPNIVGRHGPKASEKGIPKIKYMVILGLSEETHGNAIGIGTADITTKAVFHQIDFDATYANSLASCDIESAMLPLIMENEKEAIAAAMKLYGGAFDQCRLVHIKNSLELSDIMVSEALVPFVKENPNLFDFYA